MERMKEFILSPEEIYYIGKVSSGKYLDYDYIAAMKDIGKRGKIKQQEILDSLERKINVYNEKNNIKISYAKGCEISTREHYYLMEELTKRADSRMYENKRLMKGKRLDGRRLNV